MLLKSSFNSLNTCSSDSIEFISKIISIFVLKSSTNCWVLIISLSFIFLTSFSKFSSKRMFKHSSWPKIPKNVASSLKTFISSINSKQTINMERISAFRLYTNKRFR